jgi:hypothetical protein
VHGPYEQVRGRIKKPPGEGGFESFPAGGMGHPDGPDDSQIITATLLET